MNNFLSDIEFSRGISVKDGLPAMLWFRRTLLILAGGLSLALCFSNSLYAQEQNAQETDVHNGA